MAENLYIVCDPPFGIMSNVLHRTFQLLNPAATVFMFFPFFYDNRLVERGYSMCDYRVKYEKHSKMNRNNTVRIFTNGNLAKIKLPKNEYKYCSECKKELGEKMTITVYSV